MSVDAEPGLSRRLSEATKADHVAAERSPFMGRLLKGAARQDEYAAYLASLAPIYAALEEPLSEMPAWVRDLHPPELHRGEALGRDLAHLCPGPPPPPVPSATALARRIRDLAASPHLWIAHAWVRYMGDLSGGQALARIVARCFELDEGRGTAFYAFPGIRDIGDFKRRYRGGLDAAPLQEDPSVTAAEARRAFEVHRHIFRELMPGPA